MTDSIEGLKAEIDRLRDELDAALEVVCDLGGEVRLPEIEAARAKRIENDRLRAVVGQVNARCDHLGMSLRTSRPNVTRSRSSLRHEGRPSACTSPAAPPRPSRPLPS